LYLQPGLNPFPFPEDYIRIRKAENRIYTPELLKNLPHVPKDHTHYDEWRIRSKSANKLLRYLKAGNAKSVLEVGCGNGWLSNLLASMGFNVVGVDVNLVELKQATEAFGNNSRVQFVFGNILDDIFVKSSFDIVVFAASLQYFKEVKSLFGHVLPLLTANGEVHIVDSPFYTTAQQPEARKRSSLYFASLGEMEMEKHYFHHSLELLKDFNFEVLYNPLTLRNRIIRKWLINHLSPFPWIRIKA
jgi:SAM-dependent methyltransferase